MSHPSLSAALKRLRAYHEWYSGTTPDADYPYKSDDELDDDIELVTAALQLAADCANHTDSADACPIFTLKLPCSWQAADKGFLHALSQCRGREAGDD